MASSLDFLGNLQREAEAFGLKEPAEMVEDVLDIENKMITRERGMRALQEPTEMQKWVVSEQRQNLEYMITKLVDISKDAGMSVESKEHLTNMIESFGYTLNKEQRTELSNAFRGTVFDPRQKKVDQWEKEYGSTRPIMPTGKWGSGTADDPYKIGPLPMNEENESAWADYILKDARYKFERRLFVDELTDTQAKEFAPQEYIQVLDQVGEGENARPARLWRLNRSTNQTEGVPNVIATADKKLWEKIGWTETAALQNNFSPNQVAFDGTKDGQPFRILSGTDLDGNPTTDEQTFGNPDVKLDYNAAKPIYDALGYLGKGLKWDSDEIPTSDVACTRIMKMLEQYKGAKVKGTAAGKEAYLSEVGLGQVLANVNAWVKSNYPNVPMMITYTEEEGDGTVKIKGTNWTLVPATDIVNTVDSNGNRVSLYYHGQSKTVRDADAKIIPDLSGQTKEEIESTPLPFTVTVESSGNMTIGDILSDKSLWTGKEAEEYMKTEAWRKRSDQLTEEGFISMFNFAKDVLGFTAVKLDDLWIIYNNAVNKGIKAMSNIPVPGTRKKQ